MVFRHTIKKDPHLRASLNTISFEQSRRPSVANAFHYRESFFADDPDKPVFWLFAP